MRQAGILAAAGIHALEHHIERLQEDHDKANRVAQALRALPAFELSETPQTNMIMLSPSMDISGLKQYLADHDIHILGTRWGFHLDIPDEDVDRLIGVCKRYSAG